MTSFSEFSSFLGYLGAITNRVGERFPAYAVIRYVGPLVLDGAATLSSVVDGDDSHDNSGSLAIATAGFFGGLAGTAIGDVAATLAFAALPFEAPLVASIVIGGAIVWGTSELVSRYAQSLTEDKLNNYEKYRNQLTEFTQTVTSAPTIAPQAFETHNEHVVGGFVTPMAVPDVSSLPVTPVVNSSTTYDFATVSPVTSLTQPKPPSRPDPMIPRGPTAPTKLTHNPGWGGNHENGSDSNRVVDRYTELGRIDVDSHGNTTTSGRSKTVTVYADGHVTYSYDKYSDYGDSIFGGGEGSAKPVLLDLSGEGLNVDELSASSKFVDFDGDGFLTRTAWAGSGTGVLVLDADGDGKISNKKEFAFTEWDSSATTDFDALKRVFDTNGNGKLDAGDDRWSEFKVELNGKMLSLGSLGIASIDLSPSGSGQSFSDGSAITGTSTFTRTDGSVGQAGDAQLVSDAGAHRIYSTSVAGQDGSNTRELVGHDADGRVAFRDVIVTSADGKITTTRFDDDGNGSIDRSQTVVYTTGGDGSLVKTVSNFNADGSLSDRTETTTSHDLLKVVTSLDKDGDGFADQRQTFLKGADGSSVTVTQALNPNGTVPSQVSVEAAADNLSKTTKVDFDGDGSVDKFIRESTVVGPDGRRTTIEETRASDGRLLSQIDSVTSGDGRNVTVSTDEDGDSAVDTKSVTQTTISSTGEITSEATIYNADSSRRGRITTVTSRDGLSKTVSTDSTGDGGFDLIVSDTTVVAADGSRTETQKQTSGSGSLLAKTVTQTTADRKLITISEDRNGDGASDSVTTISTAADGSITKTTQALSSNGSLITKSLSTTSADGLSIISELDVDGNGTLERSTLDTTVANGDGSRTRSVTVRNGNGQTLSRTLTITSPDSLSQIVKTDADGDGTFDAIATDTITLLPDGSRSETISVAGRDGSLNSRTTTTVSANRQVTTVENDVNGDGIIDGRLTTTLFADGHWESTQTDFASNGSKTAVRQSSVSADGLTKNTLIDVDGDGVTDRRVKEEMVYNGDGSVQTITTSRSADSTMLDRLTVLTTGNGLTITTAEDVNGDGLADVTSIAATTLNADGSRTKTLSSFSGTSLTGKSVTRNSASGLSSDVSADVDGDGVFDRNSVSVTTLNSDGSSQTVETLKTANGAVIRKTTADTNADQKSFRKSIDLDGNGTVDVKESVIVDGTGSKTETVETFRNDQTVSSRRMVMTSANGLTVITSLDLDGDGVFERVVKDVKVLSADGSVVRTVSEYNSSNVLASSTSTTVAGNGLTTTQVLSADGGASNVRSSTESTVLNADGGTTKTVSTFNGSTLDRKIVTTTAGNGMSTVVSIDVNGDQVVDQSLITKRLANGATEHKSIDVGTGGTVLDGRTVTTSADGLQQVIEYDNDGNGISDKQVSSAALLNANGSRTATTEERVLTQSGMVLANRTITETSADGLTVATRWDTDGNGSFDRSQTDVTGLNADGSRTRTVSEFVGANLTSRLVISTSANAQTVTKKWDVSGSGVFTQIMTDVSVRNPDGTTTRTITTTGADGAILSKSVSTTDAAGRLTSSVLKRSGLPDLSMTESVEVLADGTTRQTVITKNGDGQLADRVLTITSADKLKITVERDANGDGTVDQTYQSLVDTRGVTTTVTSDLGANGVIRDRITETISADGRRTTTVWDLDGNGANDRQRVIDRTLRADGGQTTVTTDTDTTTGTVAARTTSTVAADGKSAVTSRDVNGDGLVDQIETVAVDSTGASLATVTNNVTARNKAYLTQGAVYWVQAIAAKTETRTSADERIRVAKFDFDGDGVLETTMNTIVQLDGSEITTVSELSTSGALKATGTITVSTDGLITKLIKDSNNDGVTDHTETAVRRRDGSVTLTKSDFSSAGLLTQTVADSVSALGTLTQRVISDGQGRRTSQLEFVSDGASVNTVYDPATGQILAVSRANKSGLLTGATLYDPLNLQSWTRVEQRFDTAGKKASETQYMDDGSKAEVTFTATGATSKIDYYSASGKLSGTTDFDTAGTQSWSQQSKSFDAAGRTTSLTTVNDNGTKVQVIYDVDATKTWKTYTTNFDAQGKPTFIEQINDDNSKNTVTYDVAANQPWSRYEQSIDSAGKVLNQTNFNDNGTKDVYTYDVANKQPYKTYQQTYDAAGKLLAVDQTNDDNTHNTINYDVANVQPWTRYEQTKDASNRVLTRTNFNDDGSKDVITFDVAGSQTWTSSQQTTNAAGQVTGKLVVNDDGTRVKTTYYNIGKSNAYNTVETFAAGGQLMTSATGSNITHYDYNNTKKWTDYLEQLVASPTLPNHALELWYTTHWDDGTTTRSKVKPPVVLDLDGDGHIDLRPFDPTSQEHQVYFDWSGDGVGQQTAWIGPGDGFLAIDVGRGDGDAADGLIDQSKELSFTGWLSDDQAAALGPDTTDMDALRLVFDSNHDGKLDAGDERWDDFRIWRDGNQNGITDKGELITMSEAGIKLIDLLPSPNGATAFGDGSAISGSSTYETVSGERYLVADAALAYRTA